MIARVWCLLVGHRRYLETKPDLFVYCSRCGVLLDG